MEVYLGNGSVKPPCGKRYQIVTMLKSFIVLMVSMFTVTVFASPPKSYSNPIIEKNMADPTVVADEQGNYYIYASDSNRKVPIYVSSDLVNWTYCGDTFTGDQMPSAKGIDKGGVWAPDVIKHNGKYLMAYSYSKWGENRNNGIGIAVSDSPKGPFKNQGLLFTSDSSGVKNSIDPALVEDNRKLYLLWGSFNGLYMVELNWDDNGKYFIKDINSKKRIAGNAFEGSHIFKRGKYYYLFASVGRCCQKDNSTYRVVVGRSKNLFGPYLDSDGNKMLDNGYDLVVSSNEKFVGPGHGSRIITDKDGKTWYIYHSYLRGKADKGRLPMLDEIRWTKDGWPYIYKGSPSSSPTPAPNL